MKAYFFPDPADPSIFETREIENEDRGAFGNAAPLEYRAPDLFNEQEFHLDIITRQIAIYSSLNCFAVPILDQTLMTHFVASVESGLAPSEAALETRAIRAKISS